MWPVCHLARCCRAAWKEAEGEDPQGGAPPESSLVQASVMTCLLKHARKSRDCFISLLDHPARSQCSPKHHDADASFPLALHVSSPLPLGVPRTMLFTPFVFSTCCLEKKIERSCFPSPLIPFPASLTIRLPSYKTAAFSAEKGASWQEREIVKEQLGGLEGVGESCSLVPDAGCGLGPLLLLDQLSKILKLHLGWRLL